MGMISRPIRHTVNKQTFIKWMLCLTCVVSNVSQISFFVDAGLSSRLSMAIWAVLGGLVLFSTRLTIRIKALRLFGLGVIFFSFLGIASIFSRLNYWSSAHINVLIISLYVYIIGCLTSRDINCSVFNTLIWGYVISACVVAIEVYFRYFANGFNISSRIYAYDSKNSLSQILLTAIILLLFGLDQDTKKEHKLKITLIISGLFVLICIMKSRASIIGFVIIYIVALRNKDIKQKYKIWSAIIILAFVFLVLKNATLYKLIVKDILFAGRNSLNIDDLSSGRITIISRGLTEINQHLFEGIGSRYLDCYPIAVILQFGLLPGGILCIIALCPLVFAIRHIHDGNYDYLQILVLLVLATTYALNGLFEALTPLGPGVKCYFLWLLYGFLANKQMG